MTRNELVEHLLSLVEAPKINLADPRAGKMRAFNDPKRIANVAKVITPTPGHASDIRAAAQYIPSTAKYAGYGIEAITFVDKPTRSKSGHRAYRISLGVQERPKSSVITQAQSTARAGKLSVEQVPYRDIGARSSPKGGFAATDIFYKAVKDGFVPGDVHVRNIGVDPKTKKTELIDPGFVGRLTPAGQKAVHKTLVKNDPSTMSTWDLEHKMIQAANAVRGGGQRESSYYTHPNNWGKLNYDAIRPHEVGQMKIHQREKSAQAKRKLEKNKQKRFDPTKPAAIVPFKEAFMTRADLLEAILETVHRRGMADIYLGRYGPKNYGKLTPENQTAARHMAVNRWMGARDKQKKAGTPLGKSMADADEFLIGRRVAKMDDGIPLNLDMMDIHRGMNKKEFKATSSEHREIMREIVARGKRRNFSVVSNTPVKAPF